MAIVRRRDDGGTLLLSGPCRSRLRLCGKGTSHCARCQRKQIKATAGKDFFRLNGACKRTARYTLGMAAQHASKKAETRRRIVDAAYQSFWRSGFTRTSIDGIADRAGATKRTVYAYFRSKDDLLAAVLARYRELAAERLKHIGDRMPADPDGLMDTYFGQLVGWASSTPRWSGSGFTRLVVELADLPGHPARAMPAKQVVTERGLAGKRPRRGTCQSGQCARENAVDGRREVADPDPWRPRLHRCRGTRGEAPSSNRDSLLLLRRREKATTMVPCAGRGARSFPMRGGRYFCDATIESRRFVPVAPAG